MLEFIIKILLEQYGSLLWLLYNFFVVTMLQQRFTATLVDYFPTSSAQCFVPKRDNEYRSYHQKYIKFFICKPPWYAEKSLHFIYTGNSTKPFFFNYATST